MELITEIKKSFQITWFFKKSLRGGGTQAWDKDRSYLSHYLQF